MNTLPYLHPIGVRFVRRAFCCAGPPAMRITFRFVTTTLFAAAFLQFSACSKAPAPAAAKIEPAQPRSTPSPEQLAAADLEAARRVISISEILSALRRGVPKEELLAEVRRRRIATTIVEATELELAANGAGHQLIAALKDKANVLTESQEKAYMQLLAERERTAPSAKKLR